MNTITHDWNQIGDEAAQMLSDLIRIDTTNPPGNEAKACAYLKPRYEELGLTTEVVESAPGRGSIVGRKKAATTEGEALVLLSHLDVVPADPEGWTHPPFSGAIRDGFVWGRGAVDCKNATVAEYFATKLLLAEGRPLRRDIVLAATADEEAGGAFGVEWLCREHPGLLRAGFAINEGGGFGLAVRGRELYFCQSAEKGVCWFKLIARGEAGHASIPRPNTAMDRMLDALAALRKLPAPIRIAATVRELVGRVAAALGASAAPALGDDQIAAILANAIPGDELRRVLSALTRDTLAVTSVHGGSKVNVIPAKVEATIDCRVVPGSDPAALRALIERTVAPFDVAVEPIQLNPATETAAAGELYAAIERALARVRPDAALVPFMVPGGTDGRFLVAHGLQVFGFIPMHPDPTGDVSVLRLAHGIDERISIPDLILAIRILYETLKDFAAKP
jgi:acetylornithine deacetylase/succinyl-diaminopimelate desuccinylase-like protein